MAKRLQGVNPVAEKRFGKRLEKRWHLRDVLPHLQRKHADNAAEFTAPLEADALDRLKT